MTITTATTASLDTATQKLLAGSLRDLFAANTGQAAVATALAELGWDEVRASDPATATTLLFTEHGRALATSSVLDDVLLAELTPALPVATGGRAVLYPHPLDGGTLPSRGAPLRGLLLGDLDGITKVIAPYDTGASTGLLVVPAGQVADVATEASIFDPRVRWLLVEAGPLSGDLSWDHVDDAEGAWIRAQAAGRRALAAEITGICEAALEIATAHTSARVQYGRPIASFQAVRHRLAEAHVAITAARRTTEVAWMSADSPDGGAWAARMAKLRVGRAQAEVLRNTVQVLGAMGLTSESEMHRYVTRAAALDALLGGHASLAEAAGADLLHGTDAPPVVEI